MEYSVIILLLPLCMFLFLGLVGHKLSERVAGILGTIGLSVAAVLAYVVAFNYFTMPRNAEGVFDTLQPINFEWLRFTEHLHIDLGILLDPISVMMLVVITTVSLMVHIYSMGYMHGEKGFQRYYAFLSLFSFSMLGLVVATNIFQMYIFWELVGVSSYLLIGFYYTKPAAVSASKKAFIVTRFADLGFLIGILILSFFTETFDFATLMSNPSALVSETAGMTFMGCSVAAWAMALIFMGGAVGYVPVAYMVARCDGRSYSCIGAYPCRYDGCSRCLFSSPVVPYVLCRARSARTDYMGRSHYRSLCCCRCVRADRY